LIAIRLSLLAWFTITTNLTVPPQALGSKTTVIVNFFDQMDQQNLRVLDVGCGQGRDAIFIARDGHRVVGVDISANGIRDLEVAASREKLDIQGVVSDLATYQPDGMFDVILIDRTLYMLVPPVRRAVLGVLLDHVTIGRWQLIADETSNIKEFEAQALAHQARWDAGWVRRGYLYLRRI